MTVHSTTGVSRNEAMLGRSIRTTATLIAAPPEEPINLTLPYNIQLRDAMRAAHETVRQFTRRSAKTQKSHFDARIKAITFRVELAWLFWPKPPLKMQKRKLTRLWIGLYRTKAFKSDVVVEIEHIQSGRRQVVHVDRLLKCTTATDVIDEPLPGPSSSSSPSLPPSQTAPRATGMPISNEHQSAPIAPPTARPPIPTRQSARNRRIPAWYRD